MKNAEELLEKYSRRNLKEELSWAANYTRSGYMSKEYEDYYSWLALASYRRIKELEQALEAYTKTGMSPEDVGAVIETLKGGCKACGFDETDGTPEAPKVNGCREVFCALHPWRRKWHKEEQA